MSEKKRIGLLIAAALLLGIGGPTIVLGSLRESLDIWVEVLNFLFDPALLVMAIGLGIFGTAVTMIILTLAGKKEKLVRKERHTGVVVSMDHDYTLVKLRKPTNEEYRRYFDTSFLMACGVRTVGEELELAFRTTVDGASGTVSMHIAKIGETPKFTDEELEELFGDVDLEKIREAFGSHMEPG